MATICDVVGCGAVAQRRVISASSIDPDNGQPEDNPPWDFDFDLCDGHLDEARCCIERMMKAIR